MPDPVVFTVSKADPILRDGPVAGAVLNITGELPRVRETLPHAIWRAANINQHREDALQVAAALAHLPQGTIDQVLLLLLEQRASLLRVAGRWPAAEVWPEPPAAFRAMVRMVVGRFNLAGPEYPDATEATALLWESLRSRSAEEGT